MQAAARVLGNDQTFTFCGAAGGQFQLNVMMPVMADALLESIRLMSSAAAAFTDLCLAEMEANPEVCEAAVEKSLSLVTGLTPQIGYERAAALAKEAFLTRQDDPRTLPREERPAAGSTRRRPRPPADDPPAVMPLHHKARRPDPPWQPEAARLSLTGCFS